MSPELVLDFRALGVAILVFFTLIGFSMGGSRSVLVTVVSLALIVGLGEPIVARLFLGIGQRVFEVMRRAVGAGAEPESTVVTEPGLYYAIIYLATLTAAAVMSRAFLREPNLSASSRFFGAVLGGLSGLLCALMLRENLLPYLSHMYGGVWTVKVLLPETAEISASAVDGSSEPVSAGTIAYLSGLLLAIGGIVRKIWGLRSAGP